MHGKNILFIGDNSEWSEKANKCLTEHFQDVLTVFWESGEAYPTKVNSWKGEIILSFKSDLILSNEVLLNASEYALNFHPAPPEYRGIGGYNYALFNNDTQFGATCHFMVEKIDFGKIVKVIRFPVFPEEKASSLKMRTGSYCLILFYEILQLIMTNSTLPASSASWGKKLYTREEQATFISKVKSATPFNNSIL